MQASIKNGQLQTAPEFTTANHKARQLYDGNPRHHTGLSQQGIVPTTDSTSLILNHCRTSEAHIEGFTSTPCI